MKRVFLLISALCALMISLQSYAQSISQQAMLEAYRNGTLSQEQIEGMTGGANAMDGVDRSRVVRSEAGEETANVGQQIGGGGTSRDRKSVV